MNVPRWAAIGVIVFVAIIAAAVVLIAYTADAFDRATPLPFVYLADPDRNSPGRVHWVAGQSRTFTATVADVPAPALVVVSDDLRLVPDGEESAAALCIEPAAAAEVEDGQELTVYACIVTSEATIRLRNAADAQVYGTFRFQVHDAADPIPSPTPPRTSATPGPGGWRGCGAGQRRCRRNPVGCSWGPWRVLRLRHPAPAVGWRLGLDAVEPRVDRQQVRYEYARQRRH